MSLQPTNRDHRWVHVPTRESELTHMLAGLGGVCVGVGLIAATGRVAVLDSVREWLLAGSALLLIAGGLSWWRLRLMLAPSGVTFYPARWHAQFNFEWRDLQSWGWSETSYIDPEGREAKNG